MECSRPALHATVTAAKKSKAEKMLCPISSRNVLNTKPTMLIAMTHPVQRGKDPLVVMAFPMSTPPIINSSRAIAAVPKRVPL